MGEARGGAGAEEYELDGVLGMVGCEIERAHGGGGCMRARTRSVNRTWLVGFPSSQRDAADKLTEDISSDRPARAACGWSNAVRAGRWTCPVAALSD